MSNPGDKTQWDQHVEGEASGLPGAGFSTSQFPRDEVRINEPHPGSVQLQLRPKQTGSDSFTLIRQRARKYTEKHIPEGLQPWVDDVADLARRTYDQNYLCNQCELFPVENCYALTPVETTWKSTLKRLIMHRNGCRLCNLLLQALCRPENDPFNHPQISEYLKEDSPKTTKAWLAKGAKPWLFGQGEPLKNEVGVEGTEGATHRLGKLGRRTANLAANVLVGVASNATGKIISGRPVTPQYKEYIKKDLPCYLEICISPSAPSLLNAQLWGYGPGPRAAIATLSEFRLRIASETPFDSSSPPPTLHYGRIIDSKQIDVSIGSMWLQTCERHHGAKCEEQGGFYVTGKPTFFRVIDVEECCVVEMRGPQIQHCRYVVLSYTWGDANTFKLNQQNKAHLMTRFSLRQHLYEDLPKTVHDAITTAQGLGERYLWVDCLCIQQDNEMEMQEQIGMMDRIYGNAVLTLVAADATNANAGLSGVQWGSRELAQLTAEVQEGRHVMIPLPEPKGLETSLWNTRAWTLQERLLSRRLMIFIGGQVVWRCRETVAFEDMTEEERGREPDPFTWLSIKPQYLGINARRGYIDGSIALSRDGRANIVRSGRFTEYAKVVEEYTHRRITYPSDILKALTGLLNMFEKCFKHPMNQGLPEILLDAAILWRPAEILTRLPSSDAAIPSWSWAGWKGRVNYEEPYIIEANDRGWFKRIPKEFGQERFRPLLRWYIYKAGKLEPINGNALGIPLPVKEGEDLPIEWDQRPFAVESPILRCTDLPEETIRILDSQHLIFKTSCTTRFEFGKEFGDTKSKKYESRPLRRAIIETELGREVGAVLLDSQSPHIFDKAKHEFIVISEAEYMGFGKEKLQEYDVYGAEYTLYNVMLIEWDKHRKIANRLGCGRVLKAAWKNAKPQSEVIILG